MASTTEPQLYVILTRVAADANKRACLVLGPYREVMIRPLWGKSGVAVWAQGGGLLGDHWHMTITEQGKWRLHDDREEEDGPVWHLWSIKQMSPEEAAAMDRSERC
jgi:hypothetical protein